MRSIGLRPNISKTTIVPPGSRKIVLGLCVNDNVPRLSRDFKQRLKTHVHYIVRFGILKHSRARKFDSVVGFREHLKGLIRYAKHIEPDFTRKLLSELNKSDWKA